MGERTIQDLQMKQALPLSVKILLTKDRIRQWVNEYGEDGVYVSFSCGKLPASQNDGISSTD